MNSDNLKTLFSRFGDIEASEWEFLLENSEEKKYEKGESLNKGGAISEKVWVITSGLVKSIYQRDDGTEFVKNFITPGNCVSSLLDKSLKPNVNEAITAISETEAIVFKQELIDTLEERSPKWVKGISNMMREFYAIKEVREYELIMLEAKERYFHFLERFPDHKSMISQKDIAAYIGISETSFSRLKRQLKK